MISIAKKAAWLFLLLGAPASLSAQQVELSANDAPKMELKNKKSWYENLNIRGYAQVRYNRLLETNPKLGCEQCDRSWGDEGGFFLRRVRIIFFGQISPRVYLYIQPDFASSPSTDRLHFGQLRDAYFDVGIDSKNEFRLRFGQSKIPFGFENMQSSQNRLPLDRNDALNSPVSNERDLGVFFYWAPQEKRELLARLVRDGLKGSGDYGIFGFGAFNGQTANNPEANNSSHLVTRVTWPFETQSGQIFEASLQGYSGFYRIPTANLSDKVKYKTDRNYLDQRVAGTFVMYPQPFGIQTEYNIGQGPEFNKHTDSIETRPLNGGYVMLNYQFKFKDQMLFPFARYHYYSGGKKHERDARSYRVSEIEIGAEWQPFKSFELVAMYVISNRRYEDFRLQDNAQRGNLLRLQAQVNF